MNNYEEEFEQMHDAYLARCRAIERRRRLRLAAMWIVFAGIAFGPLVWKWWVGGVM